MASTQLSTTYDDTAETQTATIADGMFASAAMLGAIGGALAGTSIAGPAFHDFARVLAGTFGVVLGSVIGGTVGRYLLFPAFTTLARHRS